MDEQKPQVQDTLNRIPETEIKILGKFSNNFKPKLPHEPFETIKFESPMLPFCPDLPNIRNDPNYQIRPKKIFSDGNVLAAIDELDNLWLISDIFAHHINASALLHRKVRSVSLSENECIIGNKKNPILLNWGAKKYVPLEKLEPIKIVQRISRFQANFFKAFFINGVNKDDQFYYSLSKKVENTNKLYQINIKESPPLAPDVDAEPVYCTEVIAYPTASSFTIKEKIVGISVGKFHSMCWTTGGSLYTWGNRSIALGYENLPDEKTVNRPKRAKKLNVFVTMGFAGTHYSLALSSDGKVYEWGIKEEPNQLNEELIFDPRQVRFKEEDPQPKIVLLKGSKDQFGCLTSSHQLYIWGQKMAKVLPPEVKIPAKWKYGNLFAPVLVPYLNHVKVVDFCFGGSFVAILTAPLNSHIMAEEQKVYWDDMIRRVKHKLNLKTESHETSKYLNIKTITESDGFFQPKDSVTVFTSQPLNAVEKAYQDRSLKKEYFNFLKNEPLFFSKIMSNEKENHMYNPGATMHNMRVNTQITHSYSYSCSSKTKKFTHSPNPHGKKFGDRTLNNLQDRLKKVRTLQKEKSSTVNVVALKKAEPSISRNISSVAVREPTVQQACVSHEKITEGEIEPEQNMAKRIGSECFSETFRHRRVHPRGFNKDLTSLNFYKINQPTQSYNEKLKRVVQRKRSLEESYLDSISKKVEENSIEYRNKRHQQIHQAKIEQKTKNLLKHTLQNFLIKSYLVRALVCPIEEARKLKIEEFARNLHLSRIQKNLRRVFIQARVKQRLKKLSTVKFSTYVKLRYYFKKYVDRKRSQKERKMKKIVAEELYKSVMREKLRFGLSKTKLNVRKLQKFREWLVITKMERVKCLKMLWKNHLLSVVKIKNESDCALAAKCSMDNCSFQQLYQEKVAANPMLKLEVFLQKSPIFQLRYEFFQSLMFLFKKENPGKTSIIDSQIKKVKRKQKIKFSGENELFSQVSAFQVNNDILPFSLHYNMLQRPKSVEISIPESMKKSDKWIRQQRLIFDKILKQVLEDHERNFLKERRAYDKELAYFIREKYEALAEKRWRYILEYNQLQATAYKRKKLKELFRIFDLIGSRKMLTEDYLPEKHMMLEQAVKRKDAPTPPSCYPVFGIQQFREAFKKYYEAVSHRSKQMRKGFM